MKKETLGQSPADFGKMNMDSAGNGMNLKVERPKILLHSCCGPCSTACIERLMDDYEVTVFFYNPNITDEGEYQMRLDAQKTVIEKFNERGAFMLSRIGFIEGTYKTEEFFRSVRGFEDQPEGGLRCSQCFQLRLSETARKAKCSGFDYFATTLTVSPHKNYKIISEIGKDIAEQFGIGYLDMDFKKKAGFQRSLELSKKFGLYRQNYCGCEFSKWFLNK